MIRITGEVRDFFVDPIPDELVPIDEVGQELADRMRQRIHDDGMDADGRPWIGGRHFVRTGQLRDSLDASSTPTETTITYADTGRRDGSETNQEVARRVFSPERVSPMQPSPSELEAARRIALSGMERAIIKSGASGSPSRLVKGSVRVR